MKKFLMLFLILATPVFAVLPDEILPNADQEARARIISKGLRCLVCRNESIDDSNAGLARDIRLLVRERIVAGDDNRDVITYVVDRYGEFVLLRPTLTGSNLVLWASGPVMLIFALGFGYSFVRRRKGQGPVELNSEEQARLAEILRQ